MREPGLDEIDDYRGEESKEKKLTVQIVVLSGLVIAALYGWMNASALDAKDVNTSIKITK